MIATNPLHRLAALGQSIWLDDLRRAWLTDGTLARLIAEDAVTGVTSNPTIFERAITQHSDYDAAIARLAREASPVQQIYESLAIEDGRGAADLLRPVHQKSDGRDGFVSVEISPHFAYDAEASIAEGRRLWERVGRQNLMIKVPATGSGLLALRALTVAGINVNATLLFSVARYRAVADAYMAGLEARQRLHVGPLAPVHSVASFFLSRIDTLIDPRLDAIGTPAAKALSGAAAVSCATLAYQEYWQILRTPRWRALAALGAQPQRLLWASTSTKENAHSDLRYIESLVAPQTINAMPAATLAAFRGHGHPAVRIDDDLENVRALKARLAWFGIRLDEIAGELQAQGLRKFVASYDRLLAALAQRATDFGPAGHAHGQS